MITYEWNFPAFDCKVDDNGLNKVVTTVHWTYNGTDEDGISSGIYGAQAVGEPNPDAFTPYPEISKEQVIGWMEGVMDIDAMNKSLADQIDLIKNPIQITLPPPFEKK